MNFDLESYQSIKPCLAPKDTKLALDHGELLRSLSAESERPLRVLDIGAGDATFLAKLCAAYGHSRTSATKRLSLDLIEPHPFAEGLQIANLEPHASLLERASFQNVTLQDFRRSTQNQPYDAVLCTHVFYHLPFDLWPDMVEFLTRQLRPGGYLRITLVSRRSWQYELTELLGAPTVADSTAQVRDTSGSLVFAEDLETVLLASGAAYSAHRVAAPLDFRLAPYESRPDSVQYLGAAFEIVCRFLAFVLRRSLESVVALGRHRVCELLQLAGASRPMSVDHVFQIRRT